MGMNFKHTVRQKKGTEKWHFFSFLLYILWSEIAQEFRGGAPGGAPGSWIPTISWSRMFSVVTSSTALCPKQFACVKLHQYSLLVVYMYFYLSDSWHYFAFYNRKPQAQEHTAKHTRLLCLIQSRKWQEIMVCSSLLEVMENTRQFSVRFNLKINSCYQLNIMYRKSKEDKLN